MINPIKLDFNNLRFMRQKINNNNVYNSIKNKNKELLYKYCNKKELDRVLKETELNIEELILECSKNDITNKILSGRISIKSSRQGSKDESIQIDLCKNIANNFKINIINLNSKEYRPKKDGQIITEKEMKEKKIKKENCLKSFDGKIEGKLNGWIFSKIVFGKGGHQDNVFEEADNLCDWIKKFQKEENIIYFLIIDTDLNKKFEDLKNKYLNFKNIYICDCYNFQEYIIKNYKN